MKRGDAKLFNELKKSPKGPELIELEYSLVK